MYPNSVFGVQSALAGATAAIHDLQVTCNDLRKRVDAMSGPAASSASSGPLLVASSGGTEKLDALVTEVAAIRTKLDEAVLAVSLSAKQETKVVESSLEQMRTLEQMDRMKSDLTAQISVEVKRQKELLDTSLSSRYDAIIPGIVMRQLDTFIDAKYDARFDELTTRCHVLEGVSASTLNSLSCFHKALDLLNTRGSTVETGPTGPTDATVPTDIPTGPNVHTIPPDQATTPSEPPSYDDSIHHEKVPGAKGRRSKVTAARITPVIKSAGISLDLSSSTDCLTQPVA